jgi:hypothetical protein
MYCRVFFKVADDAGRFWAVRHNFVADDASAKNVRHFLNPLFETSATFWELKKVEKLDLGGVFDPKIRTWSPPKKLWKNAGKT